MMTKTLIFALTATIGFSLNANAATFVVNATGDTQDAVPGDGICADAGAACSLRAAITEANALAGADIITLPAGTYTQTLIAASENLNAGGDFDITSEITINGAGSGTTIIEANALPNTATERVIHCITAATAVVINDVTVRHGNDNLGTFASSGGGIRLDTGNTNLTLNRVIVSNNRSAGRGGGIYCALSGIVLNINDSTISNNSAGSSVAGSGGTGAGIDVAISARRSTSPIQSLPETRLIHRWSTLLEQGSMSKAQVPRSRSRGARSAIIAQRAPGTGSPAEFIISRQPSISSIRP